MRCHARWERRSLIDRSQQPPQDSDTLDFGKHCRQTYSKTYYLHKRYCDWVVDTSHNEPDCGKALLRFAGYIIQKRDEEESQRQLDRLDRNDVAMELMEEEVPEGEFPESWMLTPSRQNRARSSVDDADL